MPVTPAPASVLLDAISRHASEHPEAIAAVLDSETLTYRELDRRANGLAQRLVEHGAGPEEFVGILIERSFEMLIAVVGCMKSGAAYLPLDPSTPADRLATMIRGAAARIVLTNVDVGDRVPRGPVRLTVADAPGAHAAPDIGLRPDDAAYAIFTSGSTGTPKCVVVEHGSVNNFLEWSVRFFDVRPDDRFLQFAPLWFDGSIWELFTPLVRRATVRLLREGEPRQLEVVERIMREEAITHVDLLPSVLRLLSPDAAKALRWCMTGGEPVPAEIVSRWTAPGRHVVNGYGPTEATDLTIVGICDPGEPGDPPLGRPIDNARAYVLDEQLACVEVGGVGELCLAGAALARGYLGMPAETARRFVRDPRFPGGRLYRTGDLARRREDGAIEFVGRRDDQVKIRGHRVELGDVEAALGRCQGVEACAVVAVPRGDGGALRLVAFVVGVPRDLAEQLRRLVPDAMVPSEFVSVEGLPVRASGKMDRQALRVRAAHGPAIDYRPGEDDGPALAALRRCVSEVTDAAAVSGTDSFLALGGNSLDAMRVVAAMRRHGFRVAIRRLLSQTPLAVVAAECGTTKTHEPEETAR
jgi:amino acid adenylation domain-containing protein